MHFVHGIDCSILYQPAMFVRNADCALLYHVLARFGTAACSSTSYKQVSVHHLRHSLEILCLNQLQTRHKLYSLVPYYLLFSLVLYVLTSCSF